MTGPVDEFETFLTRRTVLPKGMSDDDQLEPPKALDAIVLRKAREAIRARQGLNRTPRWATPVAVAATILLCLSIVLNVTLNTNRSAALRHMTAATADNASPAPASPAGEGERRKDFAGGSSSREAILPEEKLAESRAPRPPVLAEAAPAADAPAAPSPSAAPPAAPATMARVAPPAAPASAAPSPPGTAPAADGVAEAQDREQPALAKRNAAAALPQPQDPKTWLQQIAALRAEGKTAQADAEMQRFRAIFPGYPTKPAPSTPSEPPK
jgi:hypothetical protein